MGWFDCGIMGGDMPMDVLGDISEKLRVSNDDAMAGIEDSEDYFGYMIFPLDRISKAHGKRIAKALKEKWDRIEKIMDNYRNNKYCDKKNIAIQVVATLIMASGASFPRGFRIKARIAGRNDEWAERSKERKARIIEYIQAVSDHKTGKRVLLETEGLMDKLDKFVSGD